MKTTKHKGRAPLKKQNAPFLVQCQEGNRLRDAYWASFWLERLARRTKPVKTKDIVANVFLHYCIAAWKNRDKKFFEHLTRPLKWKMGSVHADPAAYSLMNHFLEDPFEQENRQKVYSIREIKKFCNDPRISDRKAARLARAFGLKIRSKGKHGKAWPDASKK